MKIITWNVNGIRSRVFNNNTSVQIGKVKNVEVEDGSPMAKILELEPDIICLQETRCDTSQGSRFKIAGFKSVFNESKGVCARSANRYSGTCVFIKEHLEVEKIETQIPNYHDTEGRIIILYLKDFILITVYAPNSGTNYDKKVEFINCMLEFLISQTKSVIFCGDLNIAKSTHFDITKAKEGPGIYKHELAFYDDLLTIGFTDAIKDDPVIFTWWDPRAKKIDGIACTRHANKGWRLDYFFTKGINKVSSKVFKNIGETNPLGSDHAPVFLLTEH